MLDVERLSDLAREAEWSFPSSSGTPVLRERTGDWLDRAVAERESFVEAVRILDDEAAVELAADIWRVWIVARDVSGGRAFLAEVLDRASKPTRARSLALYGDGLLAFRQGAVDESRERSEQALVAARAAGDPEALALAHLGLSRAVFSEGDYARSCDLAAQARRHAAPLTPAMDQGPLHMHAQSARLLGWYDEAAALFEQSLELNRRIGDEGMVAVELHNLGHVEIHRGNIDSAERLFAELAEHGGGDDPYSHALTRLNRAVVALGRGDSDHAGALLRQIDSILDESGTELAYDDARELEWLRTSTGNES